MSERNKQNIYSFCIAFELYWNLVWEPNKMSLSLAQIRFIFLFSLADCNNELCTVVSGNLKPSRKIVEFVANFISRKIRLRSPKFRWQKWTSLHLWRVNFAKNKSWFLWLAQQKFQGRFHIRGDRKNNIPIVLFLILIRNVLKLLSFHAFFCVSLSFGLFSLTPISLCATRYPIDFQFGKCVETFRTQKQIIFFSASPTLLRFCIFSWHWALVLYSWLCVCLLALLLTLSNIPTISFELFLFIHCTIAWDVSTLHSFSWNV